MINRDLIEIFIELAREKNIERSELGTIIEQLFLFIIEKETGESDNCSVIVNLDKGEIEIYVEKTIVEEDLSKVINNSDINKVFIKGKKTLFTYKHINKEKRGNILQNNADIDLSLSKIISKNDYLMIKGSNSTGLYKATQDLKKKN